MNDTFDHIDEEQPDDEALGGATVEAPALGMEEPEPGAEEPGSILERLRSATFGVARRGYDRREVDEFLARVARRMEYEREAGASSQAMRDRLQKVSESTAGILTAAEASATKLRESAVEEAAELRRSATEWADRVRREATEFADDLRTRATEEARRVRMEATEKAEQVANGAEARAEQLIEANLERRRVLEARIEALVARRTEIVEQIQTLAGELSDLASRQELTSDDDVVAEPFEAEDSFDDDDDDDDGEEPQFEEHASDEAPTRRFTTADYEAIDAAEAAEVTDDSDDPEDEELSPDEYEDSEPEEDEQAARPNPFRRRRFSR
jgi:DivIVA domain-containing protein